MSEFLFELYLEFKRRARIHYREAFWKPELDDNFRQSSLLDFNPLLSVMVIGTLLSDGDWNSAYSLEYIGNYLSS